MSASYDGPDATDLFRAPNHDEYIHLLTTDTPVIQPSDLTGYEYSARPELGASTEIEIISEVGREITRLRTDKMNQLLSRARLFRQATRLFSIHTNDPATRLYHELVDQESRIGHQVFGSPPAGQEWIFYFENSNGQDEWFFERRLQADSANRSIVRYIREPAQVRKVEDGLRSEVLDDSELANLATAAQRYLHLIDKELYSTPATQSGDMAT